MRDPRPGTTNPHSHRPDQAAAIPDPIARALHRRRTLDEQQRTYQGIYPPPHFPRRRPNG